MGEQGFLAHGASISLFPENTAAISSFFATGMSLVAAFISQSSAGFGSRFETGVMLVLFKMISGDGLSLDISGFIFLAG